VIRDWTGSVTVVLARPPAAFHPALPANASVQLLGDTTGFLHQGVVYYWNLKARPRPGGLRDRLVSPPVGDATPARVCAARGLVTARVLMRGLPPPPRTKWTRRVPHPVLNGHAASLTPY